jgi:hypothetical protein
MPKVIEPPASFRYLLQLYEAMQAQAVDSVYAGKVTETFNSLDISMTYYTPLFNALKELGCIELLDRGVRGRPTQYKLIGAPTWEAYDARYESGLTGGAKPATVPLDEVEQRVRNLERRLEGLDIKQVIVNHEQRISAMEVKQEGGSK